MRYEALQIPLLYIVNQRVGTGRPRAKLGEVKLRVEDRIWRPQLPGPVEVVMGKEGLTQGLQVGVCLEVETRVKERVRPGTAGLTHLGVMLKPGTRRLRDLRVLLRIEGGVEEWMRAIASGIALGKVMGQGFETRGQSIWIASRVPRFVEEWAEGL